MKKRKYTSSRLRHRLSLQSEALTADGAGGYTRSWNNIADLWAEIIPLSGRERLFAGKIQAEITHRILVRYREAVNPGQRMVFEARAFHIRAVMNVHENNDLLEILATEGSAG